MSGASAEFWKRGAVSMNKYRFLLIGCGRISKNHIAAAVANRAVCDLVGVCDLVRSLAEKKADDYEAVTGARPQVYTDYKKAVEELSPDVCVIATESGSHAEIAVYCIERKKHVLVEKPMALSVLDAQRMVKEARYEGVTLGVCHQTRFNAPVMHLRRAVDTGRFGMVVNGTARILWNRDKLYYRQAPWRGTWAQDGGVLMHQCLNDIDLLQWCLGGQPETVMAMTGNYLHPIESEDFGAVLIRFHNGAVGVVEGSVCAYPENLEETLSVFGEKGTAVIGGVALNTVEMWKFASSLPQDEEVRELRENAVPDLYGTGHNALYGDFINALETKKQPLVNGEEAMKSLKIVLAAYESQKTNKMVSLDDFSFSTANMHESDVRIR